MRFFGKVIPVVTSYKYLGVLVEESLSWDTHIKKVLAKAEKSAAKYSRVFSNRQLPAKLRLRVYKTYVRPHFDYACDIWWADTKQAASLEAVQMGVLRSILQCSARTNNAAVRTLLGVVPLSLRRSRFRVNWFAKSLVEPLGSLVARLPSYSRWVGGWAGQSSLRIGLTSSRRTL